MDEKGKETIAAFDRLLTTNRIQMMKVFLSYLPPEQQSGLAIYIKLSELQYAIQFFRRYPSRPLIVGRQTILSLHSLLDGSLLTQDQAGVLELLDELMPFSEPQERRQIQNMKNLLTSFSQMREMMAMMDMMKELFPDGMDGEGGLENILSGMAGASDMTGMSGMDPSAILQMLQMFQTANTDSIRKPDETEE